MAKDRNEKEMEVFNFIKSRLSEGLLEKAKSAISKA